MRRLQNRTRERGDHRREMRALRGANRAAGEKTVDARNHEIRAKIARRSRDGRFSPANKSSTAKLDREIRRRGSRFRDHEFDGKNESFHHPPRHTFWRDLLRHFAGIEIARKIAPANRKLGRSREIFESRGGEVGSRKNGTFERKNGREIVRSRGGESGERRGNPYFCGGLCARELRDRRDHGSPRARRTRFRVRGKVRNKNKMRG